MVHESVVFRMATGFQGYAPIALPQEVKVVDRDGEPYSFAQFQEAAVRGSHRFAAMGATKGGKDMKLANHGGLPEAAQ